LALLAEELVEEWLNRNGYFTIRGIKLGVHEIDILAIKLVGSKVEARHIEVQASSNPISYLCPLSKRLQKESGRKPQSTKPRSTKEVLESVKEWVDKKYHLKRKQELRKSLYPGEWKYELVLHKVKYADEIEVVKKEGISIYSLSDIVKSMLNSKDTVVQCAVGTSLMELVRMGDGN
jgi:hypothetical protein